jgi:predicted metal-dependent HD superfamily phosphohydrolase
MNPSVPRIPGCDDELVRIAREAYESPGRHYHAWSHIEACLAQFEQAQFDAPRAALIALLFHDAVYVAGRRDNEALSAQLADETMARHCDADAAERGAVSQFIRLTASHHGHGVLSTDARTFLDIDLAVLGADEATYDAYAQGVRREFVPAAVPLDAFITGRTRFLRGLLAQPHIFLTKWMRQRREEAARHNIERELQRLPGGTAATQED